MRLVYFEKNANQGIHYQGRIKLAVTDCLKLHLEEMLRVILFSSKPLQMFYQKNSRDMKGYVKTALPSIWQKFAKSDNSEEDKDRKSFQPISLQRTSNPCHHLFQ